jgi:hypothetical protein
MKTFIIRAIGILFISMMTGQLTSSAQTDDFFTVSGIVKNQQNKKIVEFANVSVGGTNVGTVTNEDGEFTLKIKKSTNAKTIVVSQVGSCDRGFRFTQYRGAGNPQHPQKL